MSSKKKYLLTGSIIGIIVGFILLALMQFCTSRFEIPDGGGYTSDQVMGCLLLLPPTLLIAQYIENMFLSLVIFLIINGLIGLSIAWAAYKLVQKNRNKV